MIIKSGARWTSVEPCQEHNPCAVVHAVCRIQENGLLIAEHQTHLHLNRVLLTPETKNALSVVLAALSAAAAQHC